jgi:hypothetical protein
MFDLKSKPERSEEVLDLDQAICNQVNDGPVTI